MDQGDLPGAIQLYEESLQAWQLEDNTGYPALVGRQHRSHTPNAGGLGGRQEGIRTIPSDRGRKTVISWGCRMQRRGWGTCCSKRLIFPAPAKMYEQSLAIRTARGAKTMIAETQLALAELSLEEARAPVEQEAVLRQALEFFQKQKAREDEINAGCVLARALLTEGKAEAAKEAMQHARSLAAKSQNPEIRWRTAITAARIETAGEELPTPLPESRQVKSWPPSSRSRGRWVMRASNSMLVLRRLKLK